jgi:hypothetical protein
MSYDRCVKHGLMRCAMCSRPGGSTTPMVATPKSVGPIVVNTTSPDFNPEDLLSSPSPTVTQVPEGPDKQALEAMERNRAIAAAPAVEPLAANPVAEEIKFADTLANEQNNEQNTNINPIVRAAEEYALAQKRVELFALQHAELAAKLRELEAQTVEAQGDRDIKKAVLQKLVS